MTRYAFVIDQRKCIGCHACTVACKAEHDVPIGVNRTWVKYIEKGEFPNARRYFLVNRCNHCEDAPCVTICPTKALFKRADGIVDFDSTRCIGCKSCMQACPYDALYIHPDTHTAAKCNYCAHRTERALEPACVVVCPERAIIAGDMDNPQTEIAHLIAREPVRVRKPEQGTKPKVFYIGAEETIINPEAAAPELPHMTMWGTLLKSGADEAIFDGGESLRLPRTLNPLKPYAPSEIEASTAANSRIVYEPPKNSAKWGSKVSAYLWTKSIGAGVMIIAALALALYGLHGITPSMNALLGIGAPVIGGAFIAATLVLLIVDLKRPDRFLYLVTKANPTSWLVWGGVILAIFGLLQAAWFILGVINQVVTGVSGALIGLLIPTGLFGLAAAGYTAFLFGQAEGRDFWQSPLLLPILIVQAALAGSAVLGLLSWALGPIRAISTFLTIVLLIAVVVHTLLIMIEAFGAHANSHVAAAARYMSRGGLRELFWGPFFATGSIMPIIMLCFALIFPSAQPPLLGFAAIFALVGLFIYEHCFVEAGQIVPLS
jgi:Fe-S-cluster-containing dehydrogenase component/formate-dependent nitrite reductase membrane component NrfD